MNYFPNYLTIKSQIIFSINYWLPLTGEVVEDEPIHLPSADLPGSPVGGEVLKRCSGFPVHPHPHHSSQDSPLQIHLQRAGTERGELLCFI